MALNTVSSDRLSTNVKNTNFTAAEKQDLTDDIKPLLGSSGGGNKNLIINGDFQIAQRDTSSTSSGYSTVDRWQVNHSVQDAPTSAQVAVASGTSPYTLGFRKALKITNGNQSSGATAAAIFYIRQFIESQIIAQSGWNYTDSNSKITLSFWIKSSIAQSFHGHLKTFDGTEQIFPFQTGALTAGQWTKITKTIPGNSNLQFDTNSATNGADRGIAIVVAPYMGTNYTDSSATFDQWQTNSSGIFAGTDMTTTWYTTNDATLEFTGFQFEVSSVATEFDHKPFAQELALCQRYYFGGATSGTAYYGGVYSSGNSMVKVFLPVLMRATPTVTNPTHGGGGTLNTIYESNHCIHYYITGDTSVYVPRADVKCDAEL